MSLNPLTVQADPRTRSRLERQSRELGFVSPNQWAAVALRAIAELEPDNALLALGRIKMLGRGRQRGKTLES